MLEVDRLLIIDGNGNVIFSHELFSQKDEVSDPKLISGLILAIQNFIENVVEDTVSKLELRNSFIYISKNTDLDLTTAMITGKNANSKKIFKSLLKIQNKFQDIYTKYLFSKKKLREYIENEFINDFEKIFKKTIEQGFSDLFDGL